MIFKTRLDNFKFKKINFKINYSQNKRNWKKEICRLSNFKVKTKY